MKLFRFTWLRLLAFILILLFSTLAFLVGTQSGSRWLLNTVMSQINGRMVQIEGTIWTGITSKELEVTTPAVKVIAKDNALRVHWLSLLRARLQVVHLMTGDLSLELFSTEPQLEEEPATELSLPISIQVDKVLVGRFTMTDPQGRNLPVGLDNFDIEHLVLDNTGTKAELKSLVITHPDAKSSLQGTIEFEKLAYPWPMHAKLDMVNEGLHTQSPICLDYLLGRVGNIKIQTHCQIDGELHLDGGLDDLAISLNAVGVGQGLVLKADASLDLESAMPLNDLKLDLKAAKDLSLQAEIHSVPMVVEGDTTEESKKASKRLEGTLVTQNLILDLIEKGSRLDSDFDFVVDFDDQAQLEGLRFKGGIFRNSRWNATALNGGININADFSDVFIEPGVTAWEKLRLNNADIFIRLGENTIESKGQFLSHLNDFDGLKLDVDLKNLSQIDDELAGSAELKLNMIGHLGEHDIKAKLDYQPKVVDAESLSIDELLSKQYGLGNEPLDLIVDLKATLSSDEGRYHWQGSLDNVLLKHAGIELAQQNTTSLSFQQQIDDFLFEISEAKFAVTLPDAHQGDLHHLNTTVNSSGWTSAGTFNDLTIDNRLLQLVGLEDNAQARLALLNAQKKDSMSATERQAHQQAVAKAQNAIQHNKKITAITYDGDWKLDAQPDLVGAIHLNRHTGNTILPLSNPLPLDFSDINVELSKAVDDEIEQMVVSLKGQGEKSDLVAKLNLEDGFVMALKKGAIVLNTTDGGSLMVDVDTVNDLMQDQVQHWQARVDAKALDLNALSLAKVPEQSLLNLHGTVGATVLQRKLMTELIPDLKIDSGSRWNGHELSGRVKATADLTGVFALPQQIELDPSYKAPKWYQLKLTDVDTLIALDADESFINIAGELGAENGKLKLKAQMPKLAAWWPELPGQAQADLSIKGDVKEHRLSLNALYDAFLAGEEHQQPLVLNLDLLGEINFDLDTPQNWLLTLKDLDASYAGLALKNKDDVAIALTFATTRQQFAWQVGGAELKLTYPDDRETLILHQHSEGGLKQWETQGAITDGIANMALYEYVLAVADSLANKKLVVAPKKVNPEDELIFDVAWDFTQKEQLSGDLSFARKHSQGLWPFPTPVPLDFDTFNLSVKQTGTEGLADKLMVSPEGMHISAAAKGGASILDADVFLHPASPFMLERAQIDMELPDKSKLNAHVFTSSEGLHLEETRLYGVVQTSGIPLHKVSYGAVPPGMINGDLNFNMTLSEDNIPNQLFVTGQFLEGSRWNNQALKGEIDLGLSYQDMHHFNLSKGNINLHLGNASIVSNGSFGELNDRFNLSIKAPQLSALWPDLPGSVNLDLSLDGAISDNKLTAKGRFSQGNFTEVGKAPIDFDLRMVGGWKEFQGGHEGWSGSLEFIDVKHAGIAVSQPQAMSLTVIPQGEGGLPQWDIGPSTLRIGLKNRHQIDVQQGGTSGRGGKFDTKGALRGIRLTPQLIADIGETFGVDTNFESKDGKPINHGIIVRGRSLAPVNPPVFDFEWDLSFDKALTGTASLRHLSGDFLLPTDPPVPLGLQKLDLRINSQAQAGTRSLLTADFDLLTQNKGGLKGTARVNLDGFEPVFDATTQLHIKGSMSDISWLTAFTGDVVELGGAVDVDVTANYRGGNWVTSGGVKGHDMRVVEVENGIRLLNGTMDLSLNGNDVVLKRLHFPSVIRIVPNEWRTRQWIEENPPAQNGSLDITGNWNLQSSRGKVNVLFDHYPIMQRTDRFAMISGQVAIDAALPRIVVDGKVTADAGWASVDIKGTAPTLDSDVVVLRKGEKLEKPKQDSPLDLLLNFTVDLGPRFYIVGFGLDAGLRGAITIKQKDNELSAEGEFNTRGGAIEAYGQRLQIRRGRIAFEGDIANPILDIEALRRNLEVEAGMRVVGNARNPKITLVSYPDVSEVEKLSWLIMGRGPDSSGGDLAMLLTVGASLLGGDPMDEPMHRKLGIDDITVRRGDVGESGSILPRRTVGDSTAYQGQDDISEQFVKITKQLRQGINLSIEQALSGSGTVAKVSYTLIRNLTVEAKVGTVNGLELIYRRFFRD